MIMGAFVSGLKKIDSLLKESKDFFFRDFEKYLKLFVFVYYPKKSIFKKKMSFN